MGNTPPPTNYQWIGDTLSFTLDPSVGGLKLKFRKESETTYQTIFDNKSLAPTTIPLLSSNGPKGEIWGVTTSNDNEEWGPPSTADITNQTI